MKFSIVTPSYNSANYLQETIFSVISQKGNFSIEYFILDNCSVDGTSELVDKVQYLIEQGIFPIACQDVRLHFIREPDKGMYDAINRGFNMATGDIYAWINADDIYLPGAFEVVSQVFRDYPEVEWLKGITSYMNSAIYSAGKCYLYRRDWISQGLYGKYFQFIQQDSVFWRSKLWLDSGGVDPNLQLAGDYFLWKKFADYADLYSIKTYVSCFRKTQGQKSAELARYFEEIDKRYTIDTKIFNRNQFYNKFEVLIPNLLKPYFYNLLFGKYVYGLFLLDENKQINAVKGQYFQVSEFL